ncbi:cytochrome P450 [Fusarium oxysporum Fo47]|uniref:cytochrome P450 n=1 Tax=Fusarium oxysporum Fo47 TaxID=660027 RepID=UPI002869AB30|nr:cytochrome P450 [Fusarium oxysporum Fo47]QKD63102.2 cytochrome P450 [Fusarium oxysporum Fo47]
MQRYTLALPAPSRSGVQINYDILGVALKDVDYLTQCNATRTNGSATASAAQDANIELLNYFAKLVDKKIESPEPSNDVIGSLVSNELANAKTNVRVLGVLTLLEQPNQLDALIQDPSLLKPFVEELCRYHTASSFATRRVAKVDIKIRGHRGSEEALGFGWGDHGCIAASLARAEPEAVFSTLFQTLPTLKLAIPSSEINGSAPNKDIGVSELPVTWSSPQVS